MEDKMYNGLMVFLLRVLVLISITTLIVWAITTGLMADGVLPKPHDWTTWTYLLVPFQFAVIMLWSFIRMVKRQTIEEFIKSSSTQAPPVLNGRA